MAHDVIVVGGSFASVAFVEGEAVHRRRECGAKPGRPGIGAVTFGTCVAV